MKCRNSTLQNVHKGEYLENLCENDQPGGYFLLMLSAYFRFYVRQYWLIVFLLCSLEDSLILQSGSSHFHSTITIMRIGAAILRDSS